MFNCIKHNSHKLHQIVKMIAPSLHIQTRQNKMQCAPPWRCSHFRNRYQGKLCLSSFRILFLKRGKSSRISAFSRSLYDIWRPSENQVLIWKKLISGNIYPSSWPFAQAIELEGQWYNGSPRDFDTKSSWIALRQWQRVDNEVLCFAVKWRNVV